MSTFETLNAVNVNGKTEKKNGLTYLSWAWAWAEVKKVDPKATYTIYENADGWNYHTDGRTAWVKTGVTIDGIEHIEYLPVMDYRNKSIPLEGLTSFDVNKAIQRSLTKACARHGLGLYIYAGEDLPESEDKPEPKVEVDKKISESSARALAGMIAKIDPVDQAWWPDLCELYKIKKTTDITMKHYKEIVGLAEKRLAAIEGGNQ